jgi:hypothetical protein
MLRLLVTDKYCVSPVDVLPPKKTAELTKKTPFCQGFLWGGFGGAPWLAVSAINWLIFAKKVEPGHPKGLALSDFTTDVSAKAFTSVMF